ncbi:MAG: hypothetical protein AB1649_21300, partial [Chloroflexota bacterium]
MIHTKESKATVLVTNADRGSAIAVIRSLGRQSWRVIAADSIPQSLGFQSKYAHEQLLYPAPHNAPDAFVETLYQAACDRNIDLIIPVTDEAIHPLAQARARFKGVCQLALPEPRALDMVMNKDKTLHLAQQLGIPTPQSRLVRTIKDAQEAVRELCWPVVLKPKVSRNYNAEQGIIEKHSVSYANSMKELTEQVQRFEGRCEILLQEYCQGTGQGVELLTYRGRPLAVFQHKRLAEIPVSGGASAWRESVPLDPQLYDYSARLVKALAWTGLIMVEFKVGERPLLMEIN